MFSHSFKANKPSTDMFHTDLWIWAVQAKIKRCFRNFIARNSKKELLFKSSKDNSGSGLSMVEIIRHEIPKLVNVFNDHKLSTLSQRLSQINMAGIFLSRYILVHTNSRAKYNRFRPISSQRRTLCKRLKLMIKKKIIDRALVSRLFSITANDWRTDYY